MLDSARRYDIDWVRVIAIGLLLVYHIAIGFQKWGLLIGFITNKESWESLWIPMSMLNVWRIPLLFFVSGMGVFFALKKRNWKEIVIERSRRILVPFLVTIIGIVPLHVFILQTYYSWTIVYSPSPGHVWFLGNIFVYLILLLPLFYFLKQHEESKVAISIKRFFQTVWSLVFVALCFILETIWLNPTPFERYAMTWHGFVLGFLAFLFGFCFVYAGKQFWEMIKKWRAVWLITALFLFAYRFVFNNLLAPIYLISIESNLWVISIFAYSYSFLNKPSTVLIYLSKAAYPVYILHMVFLYLGSFILFPLELNVYMKYVLLVIFTLSMCLLTYELLIRRLKVIRPLFGLIEKKD